MDLDLSQSIITKYNVDRYGNPVSKATIEEQQVHSLKNLIQASGIIDEYRRIQILNKDMVEVFNLDDISASNEYYVDYSQGILHFHPSLKGNTIEFEYGNLGVEYISANRVFTKQDSDGNVVELIQDIIDQGREAIELIKTLGNAVVIIRKLENDIIVGQELHDNLLNDIAVGTPLQENINADIVEAKKWKDQLHTDVEEGKVLQPLLQETVDNAEIAKTNLDQSIANSQDDINAIQAAGNQEVLVASSEWTLVDGGFIKIVTHPCNSENIHVTFKNSDTKENITIGYKIIDKSRFEVFSTERINLSCIVSASYYRPIIDSNVDEGEIVRARKGETGLDVKIGKIDTAIADHSASLETKESKETTLEESYQSIITDKIKNVSYSEIDSYITLLKNKYPTLLTVETIGKSFLNRDIKALILGSQTAKNKLLVHSGHHAREQHMSTVVLKQLEFYCENWNEKYDGEKLADIFKNTALFVIPTVNPDGLELCRDGINTIPLDTPNRDTLINKIKLALETKIKTNILLNRDLTVNTDLNVVWNGEVGTVANYTFRNQDMHMWKANANGVDLHYNCWEDAYNGDYVKSWASSNGFDKGFASENYIGTVGMGEPENVALKGFMDKYNLWTYTISYHGKGPTCFWNYGINGLQLRRNYKIVEDLSNLSRTPHSQSINGKVGFAGYVYSKTTGNYLTLSQIRETGSGSVGINEDNNYTDTTTPYTICPLDDYQQPYIWKCEKYVPLHMAKIYVRRQDIITRDCDITSLEFSSKISTNGYLITPTENENKVIEQWGTTTATFNNNFTVLITIPFEKPFTEYNFFTGANCFNNLADNKFAINTTKELNQITLRIVSPTAITGTFNINWFAKGV